MGVATKGSQKWLQTAVNDRPEVIDGKILERIGANAIDWRSPVKSENFAEYCDSAFLDSLGRKDLAEKLGAFWPKRGPVWDGLAKSDKDDLILVEAKSHVGEICSPKTGATEASRVRIEHAMFQAANAMRSKNPDLWTRLFYQYANRLTHLWWLRTQCDANAWLIFVYFINDTDMRGPASVAEWKAAIAIVEHVLGIDKRHPFSKYVIDVFVSVDDVA